MPVVAPLLLGRYRRERPLGEGAESEVWRAIDTVSGRPVALKFYRDRKPEVIRQRIAELELLRGLSHPNIVAVLDAFLDPGSDSAVLAAELVSGVSLESAYQTATGRDRLRLTAQALEAIGYLQSRGIVHGDIKPENWVVREDRSAGCPVLLDFGLATRVGAEEFRGGTPAYLAPEVQQGASPSPQSDAYALGLTILQALTGSEFPSRSIPTRARLEPAERHLLTWLLETDPARRPAKLMDALEQFEREAGLRGGTELATELPLAGHEDERRTIRDALTALPSGQGSRDSLSVVGDRASAQARILDEALAEARRLRIPAVRLGGASSLHDLARACLLTLRVASSEIEALLGQSPGLRLGPEEEALAVRVGAVLANRTQATPFLLAMDLDGDTEPDVLAALAAWTRAARARRDLGIPSRGLLLVATPPRLPLEIPVDASFLLSPLSAADVAALLELVYPGLRTASRHLAATRLVKASGGQFLEIESRLRQASRVGAFERTGQGFRLDIEKLEASLDAPEGGEFFSLRLPTDDNERALLALLSIRPEGASAAELASLPPTLRGAQSGLQAQGLLREFGIGSATRWQWTDARAAASFRRSLDPAAQAALHRQWSELAQDVGDRLSHRLQSGQSISMEELRSAVAELGHRRARHAALLLDLALERGAWTGAERAQLSFERARLALTRGLVQEAEAELARLPSTSTVEPWSRALAFEIALHRLDLDRARSLVSSPAPAGLGPEEPLRRVVGLGLALLRAGDLAGVESLLATHADTAAAPPPLAASLANLRGLLHLRRGRYDRALAELEAAARTFREASLPIGEAYAEANAALALLRLDQADRARPLLARAETLLAQGGHLGLLAQVVTNRGILDTQKGNPLQGAQAHREARQSFLELGDRLRAAAAGASEGISWLAAERLFAAKLALRSALPDLSAQTWPRARILALAAAARVHALLGRPRAAGRFVKEALLLSRRHPGKRERLEARLAAALVRGGARARVAARRVARKAGEQAEVRIAMDALLAAAGSVAELEDLLREENSPAHVRAGAATLVLRHESEFCDQERLARVTARALRTTKRANASLARTRAEWGASQAHLSRGSNHAALKAYQRAHRSLQEVEGSMSQRGRAVFRTHALKSDLEALATATESRLKALSKGGGQSTHELAEVLTHLRALTSESSMRALLGRILESSLKLTRAEHAVLALLGDNDELEFALAKARSGRITKAPKDHVSTSVIHEVIAHGRALVVVDAASDQRYRQLLSVAAHDLHAVACVPLRDGARRIGALYLDGGPTRGVFADHDLPLLEAFADQAALAIRGLRRERSFAKERADLKRELATQRGLAAKSADPNREPRLIGHSSPMRELERMIERAAKTDLSVLVLGESGTGKELVARALHASSARVGQPFIVQNCAAIPAELFEAELFGHEKGAFTGATSARPGLFRLAHGGTLFLDEVGDLPAEHQARLLRVLADGEVRPLGGSKTHRVDVRIIAATNRDLPGLVKVSWFREDLYFRLRGFEIRVPPLRERQEDIPELVLHILSKVARNQHLSREALEVLLSHPWPGNVRELENEVQRAALLTEGTVISAQALSSHLQSGRGSLSPSAAEPPPTLETVKHEAIRKALAFTGGDKKRAAKLLGISRSTLYTMLEEQDPASRG